MTRYICVRLLQSVVLVLAVAFAVVMMMHLIPGDPARVVLGPLAPQSTVVALRRQLGLNQSVFTQYLDFVRGLAQGHLGYSVTQHASVRSLVGARVVPTLLLIAYALFIAVAVTAPLAVLSARRRNAPTDHVVRATSMVMFVMPPFWPVLVLVLLFSLKLKLLPSSGYGTGFVGHLESLTIPGLVLGLGVAPLFVRTLRAALIETLRSDYVEAARARGLSPVRVWVRYVLRNSLTATVTLVGFMAGTLVGWTVLVETVSALPGLGSLLVQAASERDFPTVQALVVMFAIGVVGMNLITDLSYLLLDPRVRL